MTPKTFPREMIESAIESVGLDVESALREEYPGRGMFGASCFAVVVGGDQELVQFFLGLARASLDECEMIMSEIDQLADAVRTDSMGRGIIAYFPGWELAE